jgi:hypothetical protein
MFRLCIFLLVLVGLINPGPSLSAQASGLPDAGQPAAAISSGPGQFYDQAKFYYNQLQNNNSLARSREN